MASRMIPKIRIKLIPVLIKPIIPHLNPFSHSDHCDYQP